MGSKNESEDMTHSFDVINAERQRDFYLHKSGHTRQCWDELCVDVFEVTRHKKKRTRCVSLRLFSKIDFADVCCMCVYTVCLIGKSNIKAKRENPSLI